MLKTAPWQLQSLRRCTYVPAGHATGLPLRSPYPLKSMNISRRGSGLLPPRAFSLSQHRRLYAADTKSQQPPFKPISQRQRCPTGSNDENQLCNHIPTTPFYLCFLFVSPLSAIDECLHQPSAKNDSVVFPFWKTQPRKTPSADNKKVSILTVL